MFRRKNDEKRRIDNMNSSDREQAISRLEREREKVDEEIENILIRYAKESGNHSVKPKRKRRNSSVNDWDFESL